jgi:hypothetical protein
MNIIIADDNEIMGYIVFELNSDNILPADSRNVYVNYWKEGFTTRGIMFTSKLHMYDHMKLFLGSDLVNYTELHRAQAFMAEAFVHHYDATQIIHIVD